MAFLAAEVVFSAPPTSLQVEDATHQLAFRPGNLEAGSIFTRQSCDGEVEDGDGKEKSGTRFAEFSSLNFQSNALTAVVLIREYQCLAASPLPPDLTILYRRLII